MPSRLNIDWNAQPLGQLFDSDLARTLGVCTATVARERNQRSIPPWVKTRAVMFWDAQPLGKIADTVLARKLGMATSTVQRQRDQRGIPPLFPIAARAFHSHGKSAQVDWDSQPLGKVSDGVIARRLGVAATSVWRARQRRNIAAWNDAKSV
jgi:hypothetical protein